MSTAAPHWGHETVSESLIFAIVTSSMAQQNRREFNVTPVDARTRLDRFLAKTAPEFSRSRIQTLIRQGHITVNGAAPRARDMVRAGDRIALVEPPMEAIDLAPEKIALSVLFEDDDLIVINKPTLVPAEKAARWLTLCCRIAKIFRVSAGRSDRALFIDWIKKRAVVWWWRRMILRTPTLRGNSRRARLTRSTWRLLPGNCGALPEASSRRLGVIAFIAGRWRLRAKAGAWREPISKSCARDERQPCFNAGCTVVELIRFAFISSILDIRSWVTRLMAEDVLDSSRGKCCTRGNLASTIHGGRGGWILKHRYRKISRKQSGK